MNPPQTANEKTAPNTNAPLKNLDLSISIKDPPSREIKSPFLVPTDGTFDLKDAASKPPKNAIEKNEAKAALVEVVKECDALQAKLYAHNMYAPLFIFQAMDAAGKDGTIRAVTTGINPAGFQVHAFKQPSLTELDHDFFWRIHSAMPERGRIGIHNRSHYEEMLVVRVHPEYLGAQRIPGKVGGEEFWLGRIESIINFEKHLARNGIIVVKFWLNVSKQEQGERFLKRLDEPESHWKFSEGDLEERRLWGSYMTAYEDLLRATSKPWAPWYAIPADDKAFMRLTVAEIMRDTLQDLKLSYPVVSDERRAKLEVLRKRLAKELE